jgi:hypothetical protein
MLSLVYGGVLYSAQPHQGLVQGARNACRPSSLHTGKRIMGI